MGSTPPPHTTFVGLKTLKFGFADTVASCNEGEIVKCRVLEVSGTKPRRNRVRVMMTFNRDNICRVEK